MTLEIGQLIINARVVADNTQQVQVNEETPHAEDNRQLQIVEQCVAEILRILEDRKER